MVEPVVEPSLVLDGARDQQIIVPGQEVAHSRLVPDASRQLPVVVVRINGEVSPNGKLFEQRRHPGTGHAGDEDAGPDASVMDFLKDGCESCARRGLDWRPPASRASSGRNPAGFSFNVYFRGSAVGCTRWPTVRAVRARHFGRQESVSRRRTFE